MAETRKHSERGPVGDQVAKNLARIRRALQMTTADLASAVSDLGVPMTPSTITKIETQARRVTVDELVACAAALNVSPVTLMLPASDEGPVSLVDGLTASWYDAWTWMHGVAPLVDPGVRVSPGTRLQWLAINQPYLRSVDLTAEETDDGPGS